MNALVHSRLDQILDQGSFQEQQAMSKQFFVCGTGTITGRPVAVYAIDPEPPAGPVDLPAVLRSQCAFLEYVQLQMLPLVYLADQPGLLPSSGTTALPVGQESILLDSCGVGGLFARLGRLSGLVPMVAVLFGRVATTQGFPVVQCDAAILVKGSGLCIGRPDAVKAMLGQNVAYEELAGAEMHCRISGTGDLLVATEAEACGMVRRYLSYLPANCREHPPCAEPVCPAPEGLNRQRLKTSQHRFPFKMHTLLHEFVDGGSLLELKPLYAGEVITAFARVAGRPLGIVASNSAVRGGVLYPESSKKISRFVSLCDAFNLPLLFLADLPGFMVGAAAEQAGSLKAASQLYACLADLNVPHLTVVVRKAYTAGVYAMAGPGFGPTAFLAFPEASIAVLGPTALERLAPGNGEADQQLLQLIRDAENPGHLVEKQLLDRIIEVDALRDELQQFLQHARVTPAENRRHTVLQS